MRTAGLLATALGVAALPGMSFVAPTIKRDAKNNSTKLWEDAAKRREIAEWNAEVDRRKAEKKARKAGVR